MDPRLRSLKGDILDIWGDAATREGALRDIYDVYGALRHPKNSPREQAHLRQLLAATADRVDKAVAAGLNALGYPRGPVGRVDVTEIPGPASGRKTPQCDVQISGPRLGDFLDTFHAPDKGLRTWVHESLHARAPFTRDYSRGYNPRRGYEEGLASGLAQIVTRDCAAMQVGSPAFPHYLRSCEILAEEIGVTTEALLRNLWAHPLGAVRDRFGGVVAGVYQAHTGRPLAPGQIAALVRAADRLFSSTQSGHLVDIRGTWKGVLP